MKLTKNSIVGILLIIQMKNYPLHLKQSKQQSELRVVNKRKRAANKRSSSPLILSGVLMLSLSVLVFSIFSLTTATADPTPIPEQETLPIYGTWQDNHFHTEWFTAHPNRGNQQNPFIINTDADMAGLAYLVNSETHDFRDQFITLGNNINLSTLPWVPVGLTNNTTVFQGTLYGGFNTLTMPNKILNPIGNTFGLFGTIGGSATIRNIQIDGEINTFVGQDGIYSIGGLAGSNPHSASFSGIINRANISVQRTTHLGGIVGFSHNFVAHSVANYGSLTTSDNAANIGGIAGRVAGGSTINSYNRGNISAPNSTNIGGIIGTRDYIHSINNVFNLGILSTHSGQIIGHNNYGFAPITNALGLSHTSLIAHGNATLVLVAIISIDGQVWNWHSNDTPTLELARNYDLFTQMVQGRLLLPTGESTLPWALASGSAFIPQFIW
ncbi:MAG: hypothetical protein FWE16_03735 [Firmicutes bacterium]|nr:hypothetical protein [Bacillota bacterium]